VVAKGGKNVFVRPALIAIKLEWQQIPPIALGRSPTQMMAKIPSRFGSSTGCIWPEVRAHVLYPHPVSPYRSGIT
jgi:hypothetical protein